MPQLKKHYGFPVGEVEDDPPAAVELGYAEASSTGSTTEMAADIARIVLYTSLALLALAVAFRLFV